MKTTHLLSALKLCKGSLMSMDFIPILSHFCFSRDTVHAFNDVHATVVKLDTGLKIGVRGDTLLGVLGTLKGETLEMSVTKESAALQLLCGKAKVQVAAMPSSDFLFEEPSDVEDLTLLCTEELMKSLSYCFDTVGMNALQREFTGITFILNANTSVGIFSTDDTRLSHFLVDQEMVDVPKVSKRKAWLVPAQSCRQMVDLWNAVKETLGGETCEITLGKEWVQMTGGNNVRFWSKTMTEDPPNYNQILEQVLPPDKAWVSMPEELVPALKRAVVLTSSEAQPKLQVTRKGKALTVSVHKGTASGNFTETFTVGGEAVEVSMEFDPLKTLGAAEPATSFALHERCLGFKKGSYTCLVSPFKNAEEDSDNLEEEDIPF